MVEPSAGSAPGTAPGGTPPVALEWTVSPWRENRLAATGAALVALGLWLLLVRLLPGDRLTASLLGVLLLASLAPGLAPTHCRVDGEGAARRVLLGWERRRWSEIRRARLAAGGLFVSPLARPGRLDRFRGLFLPLPGGDTGAATLREALRRELSEHGL